ncbi:MAG: phosphonoacetate hydrolase [Planctomycetota bacterium]|nr:phosphonoacetate hydrolase [Planctomycetota bacterium]
MPDATSPPVAFEANARRYAAERGRVYVAICLDGSADEYIDAAIARGLAPNLMRLSVVGGRYRARSVMPSFTNPNNTSIITGVPPAIHGIGGNYFIDPATGKETMMNSAEYLRAPTILARAQAAGLRVGVVTAKDKLRAILSKGLDFTPSSHPPAISVSSERVHESTLANSGIADALTIAGYAAKPEIYSADASVFVLKLGAALVRERRVDVLYLSTTDFIQHKYAPHEQGALDFYAKIDHQIGELDRLAAVLGITADHGMNAKMLPSGQPNVIYLEPLLREIDPGVRVILPITDPYVVHHAALGSFAVIHVSRPELAHRVREKLIGTPGITEVYPHAEACTVFQSPPDRTGDLVVCSGRDVCVGTSPEKHDLTKLDGLLRSHGGRYEEIVPLIFNKPLSDHHHRLAQCDPRNFDVFDFVINGCRS